MRVPQDHGGIKRVGGWADLACQHLCCLDDWISVAEIAESGGTLSDTEAAAALDKCVRQLAGRYDPVNGGFGDAPKFPRPSEINALLCDHLRCTAGNATVEARALFLFAPLVSPTGNAATNQ